MAEAFLKGVALLAALVLPLAASATTVFVTSVGPSTAQVIVNQSVVRTLEIGETSPEGVKLTDIQGDKAVLEFDKATYRMGIGDSTVSEVVLKVGRDGSFHVTARINGLSLPAIIDTGATYIGLNAELARQLGIDYLRGRHSVSNTANGPVNAYLVTLASVQVGGLTVRNVVASVLVGGQTAQSREVLIGNSFLKSVHMRRTGDTMTLMHTNGL